MSSVTAKLENRDKNIVVIIWFWMGILVNILQFEISCWMAVVVFFILLILNYLFYHIIIFRRLCNIIEEDKLSQEFNMEVRNYWDVLNKFTIEISKLNYSSKTKLFWLYWRRRKKIVKWK